MDETKRTLSLRPLLAVLAVVLAAAAFWAASGFAAGGSPSGETGARDSPAAANVQNGSEAPEDNCPERRGDSEGSSDA